MVGLLTRIFKREKQKVPKDYDRIMYSKQVAFIREEWNEYPVNLEFIICNSFSDINVFPRDGNKGDFIIGVIPWTKRNVDVLIYTKHELSFEHVLTKRLEQLTKEELKQLGLLPDRDNTICTNCKEFSTLININSLCKNCI